MSYDGILFGTGKYLVNAHILVAIYEVKTMNCPKCKGSNSRVVNSRERYDQNGSYIFRMRQCECGCRYMTEERVVGVSPGRGRTKAEMGSRLNPIPGNLNKDSLDFYRR